MKFREGQHFMIPGKALKQLTNCVRLLADIKPSAAEDLHSLIEYVKNCPTIEYAAQDKNESKTLEQILEECNLRLPED